MTLLLTSFSLYFLIDIAGDELRFGDEIECGVFVVDHINKTVKLSVRSREVNYNC